jgi:NitT/TauT family transport system substrate-binding protein
MSLNSKPRPAWRHASAVLAISMAAVLTACSSDSSDSSDSSGGSAAASGELDTVALSIYSVPGGLMAWFPYGMETGIFEKHGIELELQFSATGAAGATAELVGGQSTFALSSADSVMTGQAGGSDLRMFMGVTQAATLGLMVAEDSDIKEVSDIKGRKIAMAQGSLTAALFPAFLERHGLNTGDVEAVNVAESALAGLFVGDQVDGFISGLPAYQPQLAASGVETRGFAYADVDIPNMFGLIALGSTLEEDPDLARRMVAATAESMEAANANPEAAGEAVASYSPAAAVQPAVVAAQLEALEPFEHTSATEGEPRGFMSEEDWAASLEIAEEYRGVEPGRLKIEDLYTNEFIEQA